VDFDAKAMVKDGDPARVIVREAKEWGADLIVMGSSGYSHLKRMLMRSVTQYVVDHAPCSVEIAHRKELQVNE
jgi:nucleotide-binding universal stress UspA family protein